MKPTTLHTATATASVALIIACAAGCKSREAAPEPAQKAPAATTVPAKAPPPAKAPATPPGGLREVLLDGRKAYNAGELDRAVQAFEEAVKIAPESAEPRVDLGRALARQGSKERAMEVLAEAVRLQEGDAFARLNFGHLLSIMGQADKGLEQLRQAAKLKPKHPAILCGLVLALKKAGKAEELTKARELAKQAGADCPDGKDPFATYGDVKPPK